MRTLFRLDERIGRARWRKAEPSKRELTRDELIRRLAVTESKADGDRVSLLVYHRTAFAYDGTLFSPAADEALKFTGPVALAVGKASAALSLRRFDAECA